MKLFGTSGIRGIVNKELLHLALNVGLAVGKYYRHAVVGSDTRSSSPAMKHAFVSGLLAAGASAYDAGVIPTPTLALAAGNFDAGAVITASHNPPEYRPAKPDIVRIRIHLDNLLVLAPPILIERQIDFPETGADGKHHVSFLPSGKIAFCVRQNSVWMVVWQNGSPG